LGTGGYLLQSLKKGLDTANIIARHHRVPAAVAEGLTDIDYGEWQSLSEQDVKRLYPALLDEWHSYPHKVTMPGGESLEDVRRRAVEVVDDIPTKHNGNVLLVSHRVVIKVLVCHLLGLDNSHFWNVRQDVCGVTVFDYTDGRLVLTRHNDTSHLRELQKPILADF
jgi:broad specificity phosphatase PhoE